MTGAVGRWDGRRGGWAISGSAVGYEGRVAVVTGAGRGIGQAVARAFATSGFGLVLGDCDAAALEATVAVSGPRARAVVADVRGSDAADVLARTALEEFGRLDVWVNNAGVIADAPFGEQPVQDSDHTLDVNLRGVVSGCRAAWSVMHAQGGGHIVNIASVCALKPLAGLAVYGATKAGVLALSEALRREGRAGGVHVSAVLPYLVDTSAAAGLRARLLRAVQPEQVAAMVVRVVDRPRARVVVPRRLGWALAGAALLPQRLRDLADDLLALDAIGHAPAEDERAAYREHLTEYAAAALRVRQPAPAPSAGTAVPTLAEDIERLCPGRPRPGLSAELLATTTVPCGPYAAARLERRLHAALVAPVRHLLDGGGRRWRPRLMAAVIEALGADSHRYGPLMAACELIHTGSLMIDDIQDEAPLRRGRRAAHLVHGAATVINAGTAAYLSMDRAIRLALPDDPPLRTAVYEVYLGGLRAAHAGQALDLQGHHLEMDNALREGDVDVVLELLTLTHRLKSGAAVGAMFEIAALVSGGTPAQRQALAVLGEAVGVGYQITDDIADLQGVRHEGVLTKRVAEDLYNARVTFPLAHAAALLPRRDAIALWRQITSGLDEAGAARVVKEIEASGALDRCVREADRLVNEAWVQAEDHLPATPARDGLRDLCTTAVHRGRVA
ncbi:SDR family NAD(P)-dependent oxidoreductase [Streptomyces sp. NPDC093225]|uniref:SDR family NAD(P)-dependent oxidoreductase n=1 Tax=Streptomyces sp. NPDC093225 TaxID=3366034 RepID=UPI00380C117A